MPNRPPIDKLSAMEFPLLVEGCTRPGGSCDNQTGVFAAYPLLAQNSYAWLMGLICFIIVIALAVVFILYFLHKKKRYQAREFVVFNPFNRSMLRRGKNRSSKSRAFTNQCYEENVEGKAHRLRHQSESDEDSMECMYMCDKETVEEVSDLRPLTSPTPQPDQPDLDSDTECHITHSEQTEQNS